MLLLQDALKKVLEETPRNNETETVSIDEAYFRILAQPIVADMDQPPFDKSAMDGYACKRTDLKRFLTIKQKVAAGDPSDEIVSDSTCIQVFTGSKIPKGADCVIMQEYTLANEDGQIVFTASNTKNNICYQGEDVKRNDLLISAGSRLQSHDLAILASAGCTSPLVYKMPRIGVICTGNELVDSSRTPTDGKIRNTNAHQLLGQIQSAGAIPQYYGIIADQSVDLLRMVQKATEECDMLITTGGASVGEFDLMPEVFTQLGGHIHFREVGIQPGKPAIFAKCKGKPCWGLSGNPVSSFLQFKLLVDPSIRQLGGEHISTTRPKLTAASEIVRKKGDRDLFVPVVLNNDGQLLPVNFNGSAHIAALHGIYGFARLPQGVLQINPGQQVECITV